MQELKQALRDFAIYELWATLVDRGPAMAENQDSKDTNSLAVLRNPEFRRLVVYKLPIFDEIGLFATD